MLVGLSRAGVSGARIASPGVLSMARDLVEIGIDAQAAMPRHLAPLSATDVAVSLSRFTVEQLMRELAGEEQDRVTRVYQSVSLVNMKVDAGSVIRSHVTHCLVDSPLSPPTVPIVMDAAENTNWDTSDYETFFLTYIQTIEDKGLTICSVVHDNLPAQSNALTRVLSQSEVRPRTLDIPCFNHLINLVFIHAMRENNELREIVQEILAWQKLLRALKIVAPVVPRTRWLYIVQVIEVILSKPNLEDVMSANPDIVYSVLQTDATEVPVRFVQLHKVLTPLLVLSKKLEDRNTRLPHVIPLVVDCIREWQKLKSVMNDNATFLGILDSLVTNLIARVLSNAFDEAVPAFVLSIDGRQQINSRRLQNDTISHEQYLALHKRTNGPEAIEEAAAHPSLAAEQVNLIEDDTEAISVDGVAGDQELYLDDPSENDTEPGTASQWRRQILAENLRRISELSLDEKLNYDFLDNFMCVTCKALVTHGARIPEWAGGDKFYEVAVTQWLTCPLDDYLVALEQAQRSNPMCLDFLVWRHLLQLSRGHNDWKFWGPIAETGIRLVLAAVSEADVERLLSVQKLIQGPCTTNISAEGITARLRLYGNRDITAIDRPS